MDIIRMHDGIFFSGGRELKVDVFPSSYSHYNIGWNVFNEEACTLG